MSRRIVFMGSDAIALPGLEWIAAQPPGRAEIVGVFTQPDRPSGRGQKLSPNAIKTWAQARGLPVFHPEKLGAESLADLRALAPDTVLVMAYGHILRQTWLEAPRCGIWNLHASILPALRGAAPIQGAIVCGARESGVCLMRMVLRLDAGPVLDLERVAIDARETGATLETKLAHCCVPLLQRSLDGLFAAQPDLIAQDEAEATFTRRLVKDDGRLDFSAPAAQLARRINGLFPWPGVSIELDGEIVRVGLAEAAVDPSAAAHPGTILRSEREALVLATGQGVLRLLRLQRPGGKMMPAGDFLRGRPVMDGTLVPSMPMPELIARQAFR